MASFVVVLRYPVSLNVSYMYVLVSSEQMINRVTGTSGVLQDGQQEKS